MKSKKQIWRLLFMALAAALLIAYIFQARYFQQHPNICPSTVTQL